MDTEPRISALITLLRSDTSDPSTLIRHIAATLPTLHNPLNIKLVLQELAQAPSLFRDLTDTLYFVDAIGAATARKRQISNPTIPYPQFVHQTAEFAAQIAVLPGLAVLVGLNLEAGDAFLSRLVVHNLRFAPQIPLNHELVAAIMAKAIYFLNDHQKGLLPLQFYWPAILRLIWPFRPANFGPYSMLVGQCLQRLPEGQQEYLAATEIAVEQVAAEYEKGQDLSRYKQLLFGLTLQLEGLCNRLLHRPRGAAEICSRILCILQNLGFVSGDIDFEAHEYIYHLCIDVLMEGATSHINACTLQLAAQLQLGSPTGEGRVLFFFDTVQKLLLRVPKPTVESAVLPVVRAHLGSSSKRVLEKSHAFMLEYLRLGLSASARGETVRDDAVMYFDDLLDLFPRVISYAQLKTALASVTQILGHPLQHQTTVRGYILSRLYENVKATQPGVPLEGLVGPPTLRSCYVALLLTAVADLCDQYEFAAWLDQLSGMVPQAYSDLTLRERRYIKDQLELVVNDLGLSLADIGIHYWFAEGSRM